MRRQLHGGCKGVSAVGRRGLIRHGRPVEHCSIHIVRLDVVFDAFADDASEVSVVDFVLEHIDQIGAAHRQVGVGQVAPKHHTTSSDQRAAAALLRPGREYDRHGGGFAGLYGFVEEQLARLPVVAHQGLVHIHCITATATPPELVYLGDEDGNAAAAVVLVVADCRAQPAHRSRCSSSSIHTHTVGGRLLIAADQPSARR
mmetsp:Transcript_12134/g.35138  ORF Transcript_12134/g.35138 Transcript_12134/m.35138 type:complete len:201 (+) Transcript_12134:979-1581(+)